MPAPINTLPQPQRALLVGVTRAGEDPQATEEHLDELAALARTKGLHCVGRLTQRLARPHPATWIGSGKVAELQERVQAERVQVVVFDDELSPAQVRNLEQALPCAVLHRSLLILDIFALRARTPQAKKQVALAQYQYLLPRLTRMWTHLSRQQGGVGLRGGPGEKELETDRRLVQKKIRHLKKELATIEQQTHTQGQQHSKYVNVALVGYTNAGKSTLMRRLSRAAVLAEDKLFATLSTTVRKVTLQRIPFLLADTIGFIRKLPHTLIASFKATLAAVRHADLLLHVVDMAHPHHAKHIEVVAATLQEIGADKVPTILVGNKLDRLGALQGLTPQRRHRMLRILQQRYTARYQHPVALVCALDGVGLDNLQEQLYSYVAPRYRSLYPPRHQA